VMAVDLVIDMLHRNERGVPALAYLLMVEGTWCEGRTVRPVSVNSLSEGEIYGPAEIELSSS
jgi:hypothetical protein